MQPRRISQDLLLPMSNCAAGRPDSSPVRDKLASFLVPLGPVQAFVFQTLLPQIRLFKPLGLPVFSIFSPRRLFLISSQLHSSPAPPSSSFIQTHNHRLLIQRD